MSEYGWIPSISAPIANVHTEIYPPAGPPLKRHAACDECSEYRQCYSRSSLNMSGGAKLKCSGESTGCTRCVKQQLACHYSAQKQMGRPPKKRMRDDSDNISFGLNGNDHLDNTFDFSNPAAVTQDTSHVWPSPYLDSTSPPENISQLLSIDNDHNHIWQTDQLTSLPSTGPWPDYSNASAKSSDLFPITPDTSGIQTPSLSPPSKESPDSAQCTCLPHLFLSLSHLSSLATSPITQHTLCSLFIAAKTARDIIRCDVCPKRFATGTQNIMMLSTLLTVIADSWLRVSQANPEELGKQAAPAPYATSVMTKPNPREGWEYWLRQTVRAAVIGGPIDQAGRGECSDSPDLLSLIKETEARQRKWHSGPHPLDGVNPFQDQAARSSLAADPSTGKQPCEKDLLCLRVVGSSRAVISKFNFQPEDYPAGVVS